MISNKIFLKSIIPLLLVASLTLLLSATASAVTVKGVYCGSQTSFALDADGNVWVWGAFLGQNYLHPAKVPFIDHVTMIAPGSGGDAVVLKDDGTVWSWGTWPAEQTSCYPGQNSTTPVRLNITDVKFIASTPNTLYIVRADGSLWLCGRELCLSFDDIKTPKPALGLVQLPISNVSKVVPTLSFVYVEKDDGSWWSRGENRDYQLNDGTNVSRESPVQMQLDNVKSVSAGSMCFGINDYYKSVSTMLALDGNGQVYGWGDNTFWVCGDSAFPKDGGVNAEGDPVGYIVSSPHPVPGMSKVREIGSGTSYYAALKRDGTVWAWGSNPGCYDGQSSLDSNMPVQLPGFTDMVSMSVGDDHLLAVKKDGTVWACGSNSKGELGNGETSVYGGKPYAVQVTDLYVDLPTDASTVFVSSTPAPVPAYPLSPAPEVNTTEIPDTTLVTDEFPTPVPLPDVTADQAPGFGFTTMALLGCGLITSGMLSAFMRRNGR